MYEHSRCRAAKLSLWNFLSLFRDLQISRSRRDWSPNPSRKSLGGGSGRVFPEHKPNILFRARKIPRHSTPRPTFRMMLPKKSSFLRKINISLKLPEFSEFFSHFRETWRSRLISGDSRKFRETWQVWRCGLFRVCWRKKIHLSGSYLEFEI